MSNLDVKDQYGLRGEESEQLIHSQWASEEKVLTDEGIASMVGIEKPVLEPAWGDRGRNGKKVK